MGGKLIKFIVLLDGRKNMTKQLLITNRIAYISIVLSIYSIQLFNECHINMNMVIVWS
jgi:hypothetical protein